MVAESSAIRPSHGHVVGGLPGPGDIEIAGIVCVYVPCSFYAGWQHPKSRRIIHFIVDEVDYTKGMSNYI
ncbi:unnamed protein product [Rhodiola kirilowii]